MTHSNLYSQGNWGPGGSSGRSGIWKPVPLRRHQVVVKLPFSRYKTFLAVVMLATSRGGYSSSLPRHSFSQLLCLQSAANGSQLGPCLIFVFGLRERPLSRLGSLPVGSLRPKSGWFPVDFAGRWLLLRWQGVWFLFLHSSSRAGERGEGGSRCWGDKSRVRGWGRAKQQKAKSQV